MAALAATLAGLLGACEPEAVQQALVPRLERVLSERVHGTVKLGSARLLANAGGIEAHQVHIRSTSGQFSLQAETMHVDADLWAATQATPPALRFAHGQFALNFPDGHAKPTPGIGAWPQLVSRWAAETDLPQLSQLELEDMTVELQLGSQTAKGQVEHLLWQSAEHRAGGHVPGAEAAGLRTRLKRITFGSSEPVLSELVLELSGTGPPAQLAGTLHAELEPIRFTWRDAPVVLPSLSLTGPLSLSQSQLTAEALQLRCGQGGSFAQAPFLGGEAELRLRWQFGAPPQLTVTNLQLQGDPWRAEATRLDLRNTAATPHDFPLQPVGELQLSQLQLSVPLAAYGPQWLPTDWSLTTGASALLELPADSQEPLRAELTLSDPQLGPWSFAAGRATLQLPDTAGHWVGSAQEAAADLQLLALELERGPSKLSVKTTLPKQGAPTLQLHAHALPLRGVAGLEHGTVSATGTWGAELALRGHVGGLRIGAHASAVEGDWFFGNTRAPALTGCRAETPLGADQLQLCGSFLAGKLHGNLRWAAPSPERPTARLIAGELQLEALDPLVLLTLGEPEGVQPATAPSEAGDGDAFLSSAITGILAIRGGPLTQPRRWRGELALQQGRLDLGPLHLPLQAPARLSLAHGQVQLQGLRFASAAAALAFSGALPWLGPEPGGSAAASWRAHGDLDPSALTPHITWLQYAKGSIAVELSPSRTAQQLEVQLHPQELALDLRLPQVSKLALSQVTGRLRWNTQGLHIEELTARGLGGKLRVSGTGPARQLTGPLDLQLDASELELRPQRGVEVDLDAHLRVERTDTGQPLRWSGQLEVERLDYRRQLPFPFADGSLQQAPALTSGPGGIWALHIVQRGPWRVRNGVVDLEVASPAGLQLSRGPQQPLALRGKLVAERGRARFRGNEFTLAEGWVRFDERQALAPSFHVEAHAKSPQRPSAKLLLNADGDERQYDITVRCDAPGPRPAPYECRYRNGKLVCPDLQSLATVWTCAPSSSR